MGKRKGAEAPKRNLTEADEAAAARLRAIWKEFQDAAVARGEKRPTQQSLADRFPREKGSQGLISQYMRGDLALNYRAVSFFATALNVPESAIRSDLPEQLLNASSRDQHSPGSPPLSSHPAIFDPDILHQALVLLVDDELHAGEYGFRAMTRRLIELYERVAADGGELSPEHEKEFWAEVNRRAARGERGRDEVTVRRRNRRT